MEKNHRYVNPRTDVVVSKAQNEFNKKSSFVLGFIAQKIESGATIEDIKKILLENGYS